MHHSPSLVDTEGRRITQPQIRRAMNVNIVAGSLGNLWVVFIHRLPLTLDPDNAMQNLLDRDRRAAIGIWYLKICNEPWGAEGKDTRETTDILLGLHIVLSFAQHHSSRQHRPAEDPPAAPRSEHAVAE